jgi:uncharacterized membrane protein YphA (DoxX/SURF4 family)
MEANRPSALTAWGLTLLRIAIGWQMLYEGLVKVLAKDWTAAEYLRESTWRLAPFFRHLAESPGMLRAVDFLNMWGLGLIGVALILGLFTRLSAVLGAMLLALYYIANPPFVGLHGLVGEGSYLVVNKNLIEAVALLLLAVVPRGWMYGLDDIVGAIRDRRRQRLCRESFLDTRARVEKGFSTQRAQTELAEDPRVTQRRHFLRDLAGIPALGAFWYAVDRKRKWDSQEERLLVDAGADGLTSATLKTFTFSRLKDLKGTMTYGKIGNLKVSKVILGGNLVGGWAHARDLLYASDLVKAYHSDERVINTFRLAEKCGINTFLTHPRLLRIARKYWHEYGGTIQFISDCGGEDLAAAVKLSLDGGAHACYVQGATGDRLVEEGKTDEIRRALDTIRAAGLPAGIGGHRIKTIKVCVEKGLKPDFWMKTLHHQKYWSARPDEGDHDNNFCREPEETIEFMKTLPEPWIAFKVLAAGAIPPEEGFAYAFGNGADFICVGMYDFQVVADVNIAAATLAKVTDRARPWRA